MRVGGGGWGRVDAKHPNRREVPAPAAKISGRKEFLAVVGRIGNASFAPNGTIHPVFVCKTSLRVHGSLTTENRVLFGRKVLTYG